MNGEEELKLMRCLMGGILKSEGKEGLAER
jgi:hypothetical protein